MTLALTDISRAAPSSPIAGEHMPAMDVGDVSELMQSVLDVTRRLQDTHDALRAQVAGLSRELADANEQLRRSRALAALGEMASGISHEVRNPLASIVLYTQVLEDDLRDRPEQTSVCRRIRTAADRLDAIVRDVLSFARDTDVQRNPVRVATLIDSVIAGCDGLIHGRDIHLARGVVAPNLVLAGDESLLHQAIANLVRNSVEALVEHESSVRRIELRASRRRRRLPDGRSADRAVIAVEDTGPGIPPDVVERMFNPFFTTRSAGTGLGLAIVHRIVDAHGGEVDVQSQPGRGTIIELSLPIGTRTTNSTDSSIQVNPSSLSRALDRRVHAHESRNGLKA